MVIVETPDDPIVKVFDILVPAELYAAPVTPKSPAIVSL